MATEYRRILAVARRAAGAARRRADRAAELCMMVGLDERQSRALAAEPRVLILDEAVAALDVSIQAQVLNLLADIRDQTGVSYLLISHNLAVVRQVTERIIVMCRGQVVESGETSQVLDEPSHEYTRRLRASVPRPGWKPSREIRFTTPGAATP